MVVGTAAQPFRLPGTDGETIQDYRLDDLTATGAAVLLFYPFDFSPVCTEELCEFRDSEWLTFTDDLDVVGISTDSAYAHRQFIRQNDLPFPLLSDGDGAVSRQYDVLHDELEGHPNVSQRAVFVVDDTGTIRYEWVADHYTTSPALSEVYDTLQAMDSLEGSPSRFGDGTGEPSDGDGPTT